MVGTVEWAKKWVEGLDDINRCPRRITMTRSTIFIIALVASTPCLAGPAGTDVRQEIVQYGDLNLESDAGQTALDRRINAAARRVCNDPDSIPLEGKVRAFKCRTAAVADARRQVRTVTVDLAMSVPVKPH